MAGSGALRLVHCSIDTRPAEAESLGDLGATAVFVLAMLSSCHSRRRFVSNSADVLLFAAILLQIDFG